ncbi:metallophosphoesterase family protein [Legionella antarctica]
MVNAFLEDIALSKPDLIIISGDLTQRARTKEYQQLSKFLNYFTMPLLIVPGNHDIPLYNPFKRFLHPFKNYIQYVSSQLEASFSTEEVNILGVNSATPFKIKDGNLSDEAIAQIKNHFSNTPNQLNILFFHHNLQYFLGLHQPLNNTAEFLTYLKESPIHIVCTGHLHYATLKLINKNRGEQCALLHAGSTFCPRTHDGKNSYYSMNVNQLRCSIDWRVFHNKAFKSDQIYDLDFSPKGITDGKLQ